MATKGRTSTKARPLVEVAPTSLEFIGSLRWLDGPPLLDQVELYRRR